MNAHFTISVDVAASRLDIAMSGFFEQSDIGRFVTDLRTKHQRLRCGANEHCTLVDIREMMIQSQSAVESFAKILADRAFASRRIAFVVAAGLARAQIQRAAARSSSNFLASMEEAEAWLTQRYHAPHRSNPAQLSPFAC